MPAVVISGVQDCSCYLYMQIYKDLQDNNIDIYENDILICIDMLILIIFVWVIECIYMNMFLLLLFGAAVLGILIWAIKEDGRQKEEKEESDRYAEFKLKWEAERKEYDLAKAQALATLEADLGACTKEIAISYDSEFSLSQSVYAFEQSSKIILDGNILNFNDIIGFSLQNKSKIIYNATTTGSSRKNLGNMIKRNVVGNIVAGELGATLGVLTTREDYEYETSFDSEEDNHYIIYVNIDSISNPTIILDLDDKEQDAYEITNLLNVIIKRAEKANEDSL